MNYRLLDDARKALNWSLERTAEESGIPFQTVKNVLTGKTENPRIDTVKFLSDALNVPIQKLYASEDEIIKEEVIDEMIDKIANEDKVSEASVLAIKEMYEHQITMMKESNQEHIKNIRDHYERHISEIKEHYEKRLADKREHIDTIMLDKKWFRLASVFSVVALIGLFLFIEFMSPGHGWLTFGK